jgi:hypothetical protein
MGDGWGIEALSEPANQGLYLPFDLEALMEWVIQGYYDL